MRPRNLALVTFGSLALFACASIVGINDAELDPELSGGAAGSDDGDSGAPGAGRAGRGGGAGTGAAGSGAGGASGEAGAGGDAGANAGEGGQGGTGGGSVVDLCPTYCETVMRNCPDDLRVYTSKDVCLRICAQLPQGLAGAESGNSVACRLFHAEQIEIIGEASLQCPIAGPGGNGVCGENCDSFCTLRRGVCEPALSQAACLQECEGLSDSGGFTIAEDSGGSVQCRLYHVSAATFGTTIHCPHVAGDPPCAP